PRQSFRVPSQKKANPAHVCHRRGLLPIAGFFSTSAQFAFFTYSRSPAGSSFLLLFLKARKCTCHFFFASLQPSCPPYCSQNGVPETSRSGHTVPTSSALA